MPNSGDRKGGNRTRVYLICSPLGGVGKTLTSRLLLDHALAANPKARGFDTNHLDPDLERMYPLATQVVDLSSTRGQMDFFDGLVVADGAPKIVDLWHAHYELFWTQADSLGFFHEARAQGVEPVVFLQADRKDRFIHEIQTLPSRVPNLTLVLVHNVGLMETTKSDKGRIAVMGAKRLLIVPAFDAVTRRTLEEPGVLASKVRAPATEDRTAMARRELLKRVFDQLTFLDLSMSRMG